MEQGERRMTKEELEKEAEEYGIDNFEQCMYNDVKGWETDYKARVQAYIDGAEPREKQITGLSKHILELQKDKGNLIDRVRELEQQIEKMKCCGNCAKNGHICVAEEMQGKLCGKNKVKWQLRR